MSALIDALVQWRREQRNGKPGSSKWWTREHGLYHVGRVPRTDFECPLCPSFDACLISLRPFSGTGRPARRLLRGPGEGMARLARQGRMTENPITDHLDGETVREAVTPLSAEDIAELRVNFRAIPEDDRGQDERTVCALLDYIAAREPAGRDAGLAGLSFDRVLAAVKVAGVDPATDTCTLDDHHDVPFARALWAVLADPVPGGEGFIEAYESGDSGRITAAARRIAGLAPEDRAEGLDARLRDVEAILPDGWSFLMGHEENCDWWATASEPRDPKTSGYRIISSSHDGVLYGSAIEALNVLANLLAARLTPDRTPTEEERNDR